MISFHQDPSAQPSNLPTVQLLGVGLIGRSIAQNIGARGSYVTERYPSRWGAEENLAIHSQTIARGFRSARNRPLEIVWSAGSAGFGIDSTTAERELKEFEAHVRQFEVLAKEAGGRIHFTLISSAGGLFEGCRLVRPESVPSPSRPYGELKLAMEKALERASFPVKRIIRPTTVFGYIRSAQRSGLIATLIEHAVRRKESQIFGTLNTLRDYLFVEDIAAFVCRRIFSDEPANELEIALLAAGKPTSVGEIIHLVETVTRNRLQLHYSLAPWNAADITYQLSKFIDEYRPTSLATAVRMIAQDFRTRF